MQIQSEKPKVSVLLPVYNGELYLREAIESILGQTYTDFELIIMNDGSTDNSEQVVKAFHDSRIVYRKQTNQGLGATLNNAIRISRGEYLARQDADDYSYPDRFEKQIAFLERRPDCGVVGTWAKTIDSEVKKRIWNKPPPHKQPPSESFAMKYVMLFDSPFVHSSVMIRKLVFDKVGLYSTGSPLLFPEDYDLWSRIAREFEIANIPEMLQVYRRGPESITRLVDKAYIDRATEISIGNMCYVLGRDLSEQAICDLAALTNGGFHRVVSKPSFRRIATVLDALCEQLSAGDESRHKLLSEMATRTLLSIKRIYLINRYRKMFGRMMLFLNS